VVVVCGPRENLSKERNCALLVSVARLYKLWGYIVYLCVPLGENVSVVRSQGVVSRGPSSFQDPLLQGKTHPRIIGIRIEEAEV
jgi:hypothetical protein